jgi:hypothetical protein
VTFFVIFPLYWKIQTDSDSLLIANGQNITNWTWPLLVNGKDFEDEIR